MVRPLIPVPERKSHPAELPPDNPRITLNDLSNEILLQIIRYAPIVINFRYSERPHGDRPLVTLSRCSRRLFGLATSVLYEHYIEDYAGNPSVLPLFLKKLIHRPDLAALVKIYHGFASNSMHPSSHLDVTCFEDGDWIYISARIQQICQNEVQADAWMKSMKEGNWESITALTLTLVPNVQELIFEWWNHNNDIYPILLQHIARVAKLQADGHVDNFLSMRCLRKVTQECWDPEAGIGVQSLLPLLSIPSVSTFRAQMIDCCIQDTTWPRSTPVFAHITELSIVDLSMNYSAIVQFLACFPNLKTLYYNSGMSEASEESGDTDLDPPRLMTALGHLKHTLEDLSVFNQSRVGTIERDSYPIGSFAGFEKLKRLHVDLGLLTGQTRLGDSVKESEGSWSMQSIADALPASIVEVKLRKCDRNTLLPQQIFDLVASKGTNFPALQKIDIGWEGIRYPHKLSPWGPPEHPLFTKDQADQLFADCGAAGVEMVMVAKGSQPKVIEYKDGGEVVVAQDMFSLVPMDITVVDYPYENCKRGGLFPQDKYSDNPEIIFEIGRYYNS